MDRETQGIIVERPPAHMRGPQGIIQVLSGDLGPAHTPKTTPIKISVNIGKGLSWERAIGRNKQNHVAVTSGPTFYAFTNLGGTSPSEARITKTLSDWTISAIAALSDGQWVIAMNNNADVGQLVVLKTTVNNFMEVNRLRNLDKITTIAVQSDDDIIIGTGTGSVFRFDAAFKNKHASAAGLQPIAHMVVMTR